VFVSYNPAKKQNLDSDGIEIITGWYCYCKNGARTLGCCCHIAALIYYLAIARHHTELHLKQPAKKLMSILPIDSRPHCDENEIKQTAQKKRTTKEARYPDSEFEFDSDGDDDDDDKKDTQTSTRVTRLKQSQSIFFSQRSSSSSNSLENLIKPIFPKNGSNLNRVKITNTCSIDGFLLVCFAFSKLNVLNLKNPDLSALFKTMQTIADFVGKNQWHHAREEWIQFIKLPTTTNSNRLAIYSCYGT
jgi:hypothetical protein